MSSPDRYENLARVMQLRRLAQEERSWVDRSPYLMIAELMQAMGDIDKELEGSFQGVLVRPILDGLYNAVADVLVVEP